VSAQDVQDGAVSAQDAETGAVSTETLTRMAVEVLTTAEGRTKTALSHAHAARWFAARAAGKPIPVGTATPPQRPARPDKPDLLPPRDVPRRRTGSPEGRMALLHAIAHIELNAVDLHWDIIARFGHHPMPPGFYDDWVKAADEESRHFNLLCDRLEAMGSFYGALPAMPACGRRPRTPPRICRAASPWCRWCSKRAAST